MKKSPAAKVSKGKKIESTAHAPLPEVAERGAWRSVASGWKQLHGNFAEEGISLESHLFDAKEDIDWGKSFHPEALELCLNKTGTGEIRSHNQAADYRDQTLGFYGMGSDRFEATRSGGEKHSFLTVECTREFLLRQLSGYEDALGPSVRDWLSDRRNAGIIGEPRVMTFPLQQMLEVLRHPPILTSIRSLWYQSKITELLALTMFPTPPEQQSGSRRVHLVARERAERVVELLKQNLSEPPDLEAMGQRIGCSPFYLSRTFSRVMGKTIPQMLRELRIKHAAELLRSGRYNVTEAATEVGYTSLSHFSTAFCQISGCCPSLYPNSKHLINPGF